LEGVRYKPYRSQLITGRKLYIGFQKEQKSMTLNDLEGQLAALLSVLCGL